jgi:hypothetical protein
MKIKKIAAAVLAPTAVAGTVLLGWATVHASTDHPASHAASRAASHAASHVTQPQTLRPKHHQTRGVTPRGTRKPGSQTPGAPDRTTPAKRVAAAAAPTPQPAAASPSSVKTGMSAFEQCVAWRESGDNPTASSSGMFGILPSTWASLGYAGTAGQASVALQKAAFDRLYAQYGTQPWASYDGC